MSGLREALQRSRYTGFPVLDGDGKLSGIVTVADLEDLSVEDATAASTVGDVATPRDQLLVAYPHETMDVVLARLGARGFGRMPVVSHRDPRHLVGMLRREDIIRAYNVALTRREAPKPEARGHRPPQLEGTEFVGVTLRAGDQASGRQVSEFADKLPRNCVLISIRRDRQVLFPHGPTVLQPGDHLTAFVASEAAEAFFTSLRGHSPTAAPKQVPDTN